MVGSELVIPLFQEASINLGDCLSTLRQAVRWFITLLVQKTRLEVT